MLYPKRLTYGIWNEHQKKVEIISKIPNIKQFKAKNDLLSTEDTKIYCGDVITKEHILAIILYTDNDILCYNLRKAFREYDEHGIRKQDINDISEYANWAKLLYESIFVYGNNINYNTEYYHGLNNKFIFWEFVIPINMPISTSTSIDVANNFMGNNGGMVITFKNKYSLISHYKCLSVKMFSNFDYEDEMLFFNNYFVIIDIYIDFMIKETFVNDLVKCYLLLNVMFRGSDFVINDNNNGNLLSISNQKKLIYFIKFIINDNQSSNPYYTYFSLCFQYFIQNGSVWINKYCVLEAIKCGILINELALLLFDNNNINDLKPGIFFIEMEKRFLKKHCLVYTLLCDPVTFELNMKINKRKNYNFKYIISLANGEEITLLFKLWFVIQDELLSVECTVYTSLMFVECMLYLECNEIPIDKRSCIGGGNKSNTFFSIMPEYLCNQILKLSLIVRLRGYKVANEFTYTNDIQPIFIYDHVYGMYIIFVCCIFIHFITGTGIGYYNLIGKVSDKLILRK